VAYGITKPTRRNTERRLASLESQMDRVLDPDPDSLSKSPRSRRVLPQ